MAQLNFPKVDLDANSTYTENGVTYSYDPDVNTWTGDVGSSTVPGIPGFPIDVPGKIPSAEGGDYKSTGCLLISGTENGPYGDEVSLASNQDLFLKWNENCLEGAHLSTISGTLTHSIGGQVQAESSASYLLKRIPTNNELDTLIDQPLDTDVSETYLPTGFGDKGETTWVYGVTTSSDVTLSVGSQPTAALPDEQDPIEVQKDDVIQITQKTSSNTNDNVVTSLSFTDKLGATEVRYIFNTKTSDTTPTISQPDITSPGISGTTDLGPDVTLKSTTYNGLNGAGAHSSSDWEVYEADLVALSTSVITGFSKTEETVSDTDVDWSQSYLSNVGWTAIGYGPTSKMLMASVSSGDVVELRRVAISTDGVTWSRVNVPTIATGNPTQQMAAPVEGSGTNWFIGGLAMSAADHGNIYSTNGGGSWNIATISTGTRSWNLNAHPGFHSVASAGDGRMMAIADNMGIQTSGNNGGAWGWVKEATVQNTGDFTNLKSIGYDGSGRWVVIGNKLAPTQAWYSDDFGQSWTASSVPTSVNIPANKMVFADGAFAVKSNTVGGNNGSYDSVCYSKNNGVSWSAAQLPGVSDSGQTIF